MKKKQQLLYLFSIQPSENTDKIESVKAIFNSSELKKQPKKKIKDFTYKAFETFRKNGYRE